MPLDTSGKIQYKGVPKVGELRFQADPPVCNRCEQEITRKNFGWAYLTSEERTPGQSEFIECTGCTLIREAGAALTLFVARHQL